MKIPWLPGLPPAPKLAWCEKVTASATSPQHLRLVPAGEPLVTGGGLQVPTLCGLDLAGGWDTHETDFEQIRRAVANQHETSRVCTACTDIALAHA